MKKTNPGKAISAAVVLIAVAFTVASFFYRPLRKDAFCVVNVNGDYTISADTLWSDNVNVTGTLTIKSPYTLTVDSSSGTQINISAYNLIVESGAMITASGKGSAGGAAGADGSGTGFGKAGGTGKAGGGAGYGGAGGDGAGNLSSGGAAYASAAQNSPSQNGSGGGGGSTASGQAGGAGGGSIKFTIANKAVINGVISADGANGAGDTEGSGAGSGGSIYIQANIVEGAGSITANGGNAVADVGGKGGGGRIAIATSEIVNYSGTVTAAKGTTGSGTPADGTVNYPAFTTASAFFTGGAGSGESKNTFYYFPSGVNVFVWNGAGSGNLASTAANWAGGVVPTTGSSVLFTGVSAKNCTWDLTTSLTDFTMDYDYNGTVTLSENLTSTGKITIKGGTWVTSDKTINFVNMFVAMDQTHITATASVFNMTANGTLTSGNSAQNIHLKISPGVECALGIPEVTSGWVIGYFSQLTMEQDSKLSVPGVMEARLFNPRTSTNPIVQASGADIIGGGAFGFMGISGTATQNGLNASCAQGIRIWTGSVLQLSGTWNVAGLTAIGGTDSVLYLGSATFNLAKMANGYVFNGTWRVFDPGTSTVNILNGGRIGLKGGTGIGYTFNNLNLSAGGGKTLTFSAGETVTVANLSLQGTSSESKLNIRSSTADTAFNLNVTGGAYNLKYLDVKDCNASGGKKIITAASTDSGNNTNWGFSDVAGALWVNSSGDGLWSNPANWSTGVVPQAADSVTFNDISVGNCTVDQVASIANLTLDTGYTGTVTVSATDSLELNVADTIIIRDGLLYALGGCTVSFKNFYAYNTAYPNNRFSISVGRMTSSGELSSDAPSNASSINQFYNIVLDPGVTMTPKGVDAAIKARGITLGIGSQVSKDGSTRKIIRFNSWSILDQPHDEDGNPLAILDCSIFSEGAVSESVRSKPLTILGDLRLYNLQDNFVMLADWNVGGFFETCRYYNNTRYTFDTGEYNLNIGTNFMVSSTGIPADIYLRNGTHTIGGDFTSGGQDTFQCNLYLGNSTLNIGGSLNFRRVSIFPGNSTVNFIDAGKVSSLYAPIDYPLKPAEDIIGLMPFWNITSTVPGKTIRIQTGETLGISGKLTLTGANGNNLLLRNVTPGTQYNIMINPEATYDCSYLNVQDSNAAGKEIVALNSTQPGVNPNNANWIFAGENDKYWVNFSGDGKWSTAANWVPSGVPGAGNNVFFSGASTANCAIDITGTVTIKNLTLESGFATTDSYSTTGKVTMGAGADLAVIGDEATDGTITLSGGKFVDSARTIRFKNFSIAQQNDRLTSTGTWRQAASGTVVNSGYATNPIMHYIIEDNVNATVTADTWCRRLTLEGANSRASGSGFICMYVEDNGIIQAPGSSIDHLFLYPSSNVRIGAINVNNTLNFWPGGTVNLTGDWNIGVLNLGTGASVQPPLILNTGTYNLNVGSFSIGMANNDRNDVVNLGSGTHTFRGHFGQSTNATGATVDFGSSTVYLNNTSTANISFKGMAVIPGTSTVHLQGAGISNLYACTSGDNIDKIPLNNLTCETSNKTINVEAGKTLNVAGDLKITGVSGANGRVLLRSTADGSTYNVALSGKADVSYIDVKDSVATPKIIVALNTPEENIVNCTNWISNAPGDVYWTNNSGDGKWSTAGNWSTGAVPVATDNVIFNAASTANCSFDVNESAPYSTTIANLTLDTGYAGTLTLGQDIIVTGTITVNAGNITDNGKNVSFNNVAIANSSGRVTSTSPAVWKMTASGTASNPATTNTFHKFELAQGVTCTIENTLVCVTRQLIQRAGSSINMVSGAVTDGTGIVFKYSQKGESALDNPIIQEDGASIVGSGTSSAQRILFGDSTITNLNISNLSFALGYIAFYNKCDVNFSGTWNFTLNSSSGSMFRIMAEGGTVNLGNAVINANKTGGGYSAALFNFTNSTGPATINLDSAVINVSNAANSTLQIFKRSNNAAVSTLNPGTSTINISTSSSEGVIIGDGPNPLNLNNLNVNDSAGKTIYFNNLGYDGITPMVYNVASLSLEGASDNNLRLRSTTEGSSYALNVTGGAYNLKYLDVKDCNASGGKKIVTAASTDSGNNTNWVFSDVIGVLWINYSGDGKWSTAANWSTGVVPQAADSVIFDSTSTANCVIDTAAEVANLTMADGFGAGQLTLGTGIDLTVTGTINLNDGRLVQNTSSGEVKFKNLIVANESDRVTPNAAWRQTADGVVTWGSGGSPLIMKKFIIDEGVNSTCDTYGLWMRELVLGANSKIAGNGSGTASVLIYGPEADNFITQGAGSQIDLPLEIRLYSSSKYNFSQSGLVFNKGLLINNYTESARTLTITGNWIVGGNLTLKGYGQPSAGKPALTFDTNGNNLTVSGDIYLSSLNPAKILFKSGTHNITGKVYGELLDAQSEVNLGTATINLTGGFDQTNISTLDWSGAAKLNITGQDAVTVFNGDINLDAAGKELNMSAIQTGQAVSFGGGLKVSNGGKFTPGISTAKFTATSGIKLIDMAYNPDSPAINKFYNITFEGLGGTWKYSPTGSQQAMKVDNNLSLLSGTFDNTLNYDMSIGGSLISNGSGVRAIKFGTAKTWAIAGSVDFTGSNLSVDLGQNTVITVAENWDSTGTNTFNVGTSTVNLTGTGTLKAASEVEAFYNLTCAGSTKITTLDAVDNEVKPLIKNTLTLGGGTLNKTGTNNAELVLTRGAASPGATPLVLSNTTIGEGVNITFRPTTGIVNIAAGDYGAGIINAYAKVDNLTFKLADSITAAGGFNAYADNSKTTILDLNNKNLSVKYLTFGKGANTGSVTLNAGSGAVTFTTTDGLTVANDGGSHTLNMGSSVWTILKDWKLYSGAGALIMNPQTSTIIFSGPDAAYVYGDNTFYNLKCATPGKTIYFEDAASQTVTGNMIFAGSSNNKFLLTNTSQSPVNPWKLNSQGQSTVVYVNVYNCDASGGKTIIAAGSEDGGNNTNWTFTEVGTVYWTGTGNDNKWSNPDNWSVVAVPGSNDNVVFNESSTKECVVDIAAEVKSLSLDSGYTGKLTLGADISIVDNLAINQGEFDAAGFNVAVGKSFLSTGSSIRTVKMGSGAFSVGENWSSTGSNLTLDKGTASLTMSANAFVMETDGDIDFNRLTFTGTTSATITCAGTFNPASFTSATIKPSINFTATSTGKAFNPRGITFNNVTFSGIAGEWSLSDNLTAAGTVTVSAGKLIDNLKTINFKAVNIVDEPNRLASTGIWNQSEDGTITNPNVSNKFKQLNIAPTGKTTTFGSDINADTITFGVGTVKGESKALYLYAVVDPVNTHPITACSASTKLAAIKLEAVTSQKAMVLPSNLVNDAIVVHNSTGAISATGHWNLGNNVLRFYADNPEATGKLTFTDGTSNYNLTCGGVQLGSASMEDAPAYLNLGSGTHSVGYFGRGHSAPTGILSIEMAAATINNYSGNLDLSLFTHYTSGTSIIHFANASGVKRINTAGKALYSVNFNSAAAEWILDADLIIKGTIALTNGVFKANEKKLILTGQDTSIVNGNFTGASALYDFICEAPGKEIKFAPAKTIAVAGEFKISGSSASRIKLLSVTPGSQWFVDSAAANILLAEVRDSNAIKEIIATRSINLTNNTGWVFSPTRAWDGGGLDNKWSTAANWEDNQIPTSEESVIFDATSVKDCEVDIPVEVINLTIDTGYTGVISIGNDGSITSTDTISLISGNLNDSGKIVNFHDLDIADSSGRLTSTGEWRQNQGAGGIIKSPNEQNKINHLVIAYEGKTSTLESDLHVNKISFGTGTLKGEEKALNLYGNTDFISSTQNFTVGTTLALIKVHDCNAQGAFALPNSLTSGVIDWWYRTTGASATGSWNFGNNKVRFYTNSGATGSLRMMTNSLTALDVYLGSAGAANNNATLELGSGTHSVRSLSKAYDGTVTGTLSLLMGSSTLNCTGDINLTGISVTESTSTLNLTGTYAQEITTLLNKFNNVNFSGAGPFNIKGNFSAAGAVVVESKAINCSGDFIISQSFTPATSTVTMNAVSAGYKVSLPIDNAFYNLSFNGLGGEWSLESAIGVSNTLTITDGKLIDNAKAVSFKNLSIADKANILASTGVWTQSASGEVRCPNKESRINTLSICGDNNITTFSGNVAVNKLVFGTGTLAGSSRNLYIYGGSNSIDCASAFTVNSSLSGIYTEFAGSPTVSQKAFKLPNNLVTDSIYWRADAGILSASGAWDFGNNTVTFYTTPQQRKEIQLSSFALTCGTMRLGSPFEAGYPATLNLGSGTHTIENIIKAFSGTTTDTLNLLGGSSKLNVSGNIDFTGITFTPSSSTVTLQGGSGQKTIFSSGQQFYDLVFDDADTSWSLRDTLIIQRNLSLNTGTFSHNNQKVILASITQSNINGGFTFYDLECETAGKVINFAANRQQTVQGAFRVSGTSGNNVRLYSQSSPGKWSINANSSVVSYVNVKDCNALKTIVPVNSIDEGNNTGWIIGGKFTFEAPVSGAVLTVGSVVNIRWQTDSGILQAKLYYSTNAGDATPIWKPITVDPISVNPNGQKTSYAWTIPDDISDDCKVKIVAVIDGEESANLYEVSSAVKIMGVLSLTYPTAEGTGWPVTQLKNIAWQATGTIPAAKVYISTQGSQGPWQFIGETGTNTYYSWKPSDLYGEDFRSDNCYIKVTDSRYEDLVYGISGYNFMLSAGGLENLRATTLTGISSDTLVSGSRYQLRWDTGGTVSSVNISYSPDNGATWKDIAQDVANDNQFDGVSDTGPWIIPHEISDDVLLRVSDVSKTDVKAQVKVKIIPPFTIKSPVANNIWLGDTNYAITWDNAAGVVINNVKIEYTVDDGQTWSEINNGSYTKTNDLSESWKCPRVSTNAARVRISNLADTTGFAYAESATFKLKQGNVTVVTPNTQVEWKVGQVRRVEWSKTGEVNQVKLYYTTNANDQEPVWKNVVPSGASLDANALYYDWAVPNDVSDTCLIKVLDVTDVQIADTSDVTFAIKPNIVLNVPNGGQSWVTGKVYNIIWSISGTVPKVNLYYSTDNGAAWNIIASEVTNSGTYPWVIPEGAVSNNCLVKIESSTDEDSFTQSAAKFAITLASLNVTSPKAGDIWVKGDLNKEIIWISDGTVYNDLTIEYSANGTFDDAVSIALNQQNTGSYNWNIPSGIATSSTAKIRIKDAQWEAAGYTVQGISAVFEVTSPRIDALSPQADSRVAIGTNFNINWVARGNNIATVKILYSPTGNFTTDVYTVATGLQASAGTYTYSWKNGEAWKSDIPVITASAAKVRIVDETNQTIYGESSAFRVVGTLEITSPAAAQKFFVSKTAKIDWSTIGNISRVKLSYSPSGTGTDALWYNMSGLRPEDAGYEQTIVDNSALGSYTWTIPDLTPATHAPNYNVYVKIEDPDDALTFSLRQFTVTYYAIKWKVVDDAGLVGDLQGLIVESIDLASGSQYEKASGQNSGAIRYYYPNKKYTSVWSRDAYLETAVTEWEAYADGKVKLIDGTIVDTFNTSTPFLVKMPQKLIEKARKVEGQNYYDANSDTLSISGWLMEQEKMIPKNDDNSGISGVTEGYVEIFDEDNKLVSTSDLAFSKALNTTGIFNVKWVDLRKDGKLLSGKRYFARIRMMYQGAYHWGGVSFEITAALDIQAIQAGLGVSGGSTVVSELEKRLGVSGAGTETIAAKVQSVADKAMSILTAAEKTIPDRIATMKQEVTDSIQQEVKPHVQSSILTRTTTVRMGDTVDVSYRTTSGLSPTITVYDPKNRIRLNSQAMTEVDDTGVYVYKVRFLSAWGLGDFTVVCTEAATGTADALIMTVTQSDIEEVSGQVAAVVGATSGLTQFKDTAAQISSQFGEIDAALAKITSGIAGKAEEAVGALGSLQTVFGQLEQISAQIKGISGAAEGINLEKLYNVSKEKSEDVDYIKNKTQELKAAMDLNQKLMQNVANKPVVQTWFEFK